MFVQNRKLPDPDAEAAGAKVVPFVVEEAPNVVNGDFVVVEDEMNEGN